MDLNHRPRPYQEGDLRNIFAAIMAMDSIPTAFSCTYELRMQNRERNGEFRCVETLRAKKRNCVVTSVEPDDTTK